MRRGVWGVECGVWSAGISEESGDVATQLETAPPGFKPLLRSRLETLDGASGTGK